MSGAIEIKGGAGIFEAAVIAVVLDHIKTEEKALSTGTDRNGSRLPAWVRALDNGGDINLPPFNPR